MSQETRFNVGLFNLAVDESVFFEEDHCCGDVICCPTVCRDGFQFTSGESGTFGFIEIYGEMEDRVGQLTLLRRWIGYFVEFKRHLGQLL